MVPIGEPNVRPSSSSSHSSAHSDALSFSLQTIMAVAPSHAPRSHHSPLSSISFTSSFSSREFRTKAAHFLTTSCRCSRNGTGAGRGLVRAYMENPNSVASIAGKVIGSLPLVGLLARIFSDEGGVGGDLVDFAEFRRRVGKKCGITDSRAFYEFQDRRGRAGDPLYVLLCCWVAAVGAGLVKSEEILEGVARLRISNDIEFEEQAFMAIMSEAKERRAKLKTSSPEIPIAIRAEKALEAVYVCCFGKDPIEEEDERLLCIMLNAVFPSVGQSEVRRIVSAKAKQVADGENSSFNEPKTLSEEAVKQQLKELQFLKQNREA